ncbi:hypothetical protein BG258_08845 [Lysinibacillus fusiformis]|uniref:N-acetyltransferase domain-containing protein n=2 Tax=Lysinibacillus fusiformis TaxID=28031 RepID=A0A1E4R6C3_9BACI|nr:hypothetical protein BG258_08845 [Lysinibacillus fusiformis]
MYIYDTLDHESFENEEFYGKKSYFIWHMMIDKRYQGKGYGKLAFEKMLMDIEKMPYGEAKYVTLVYHTSHDKAKALYASFGFVDTGIIQDHSMLAIKHLDKNNLSYRKVMKLSASRPITKFNIYTPIGCFLKKKASFFLKKARMGNNISF